MDCSPSDFSVHEIFQARILESVAISSSRGSSWPRDRTHISCVSCIGGWILYLGSSNRLQYSIKALLSCTLGNQSVHETCSRATLPFLWHWLYCGGPSPNPHSFVWNSFRPETSLALFWWVTWKQETEIPKGKLNSFNGLLPPSQASSSS